MGVLVRGQPVEAELPLRGWMSFIVMSGEKRPISHAGADLMIPGLSF